MSIFRSLFGDREDADEVVDQPMTSAIFTEGAVHWLDTMPVKSTDKPCTLRSLKVEANVRGIYATVQQTIRIANPNKRPISTNVTLPLPDRAVVCGYALEIDGELVDGVVVPKEQARTIFETEQRRMADPGLAEAVRGNVYSTRVYPVPPQGTRTIRLSYVTPLLLGPDASAQLDLPMPPEHLDERVMRIAVEKLDAPAPVISGLAGAVVRQTTHSWSVETEERDLTPTEAVRVTLPELPESFVLLERDEAGEVWMCASAQTTPPKDDTLLPALSSLTVLWDASGSRAKVSHEQELALLEAYAQAPSVNKIVLVVFADRVREVCTFDSATELIGYLRALHYDGGTNLAALKDAAEPLAEARRSISQGAACVLFSDGIDTLSDQTFSLPENISCLAITSGTQRDAEALRQGCRGPVLDLAQAPSNAEELVRLLVGSHRFGVSDIAGRGLADVCDVSAPVGDRRSVIARLSLDEARIRIGEGAGELTLKAADAREGDVLSRAWASRRITLLSPRYEENKDELLSLGKRFGMASPATSLLVLETIEQWVRYEIEPPKSLTRMHDNWVRTMERKMRHDSPESRAQAHHNRLTRAWADLMNWWNETPEQRAAKRKQAERHLHGNLSAISDRETGSMNLELSMSMPVGASARSAAPPRLATLMMPRRAAARADIMAEESAAPSPDVDLMAEEPAAQEDSASSSATSSSPSMSVSVKAWMPEAPYLKALDQAHDDARGAYFEQRATYAGSPSFFLDCAGWFMAHGDADFGVSVLTNLAELRIEDATLLRVMAWRLREAGELDLALVTLRRVLRLRGEDSQSHRDLALVLSELAHEALANKSEEAARAYAEESGELYRKCALTPWQRRPIAIALFAVEEYNVLRAWAEAQSWQTAPELPSLGEDLEGVLHCDLRITLAWDADETDVDIHVTEPSGEEAYYHHRHTSSGGRVSEDITDGFGPELYEIRNANPGTYLIRAHYYASHQQTVFGPATCTLTVYSDWGRDNQTQHITSVRLDHKNTMTTVGTASYGTQDQPVQAGEGDNSRRVSAIEWGMGLEEVMEILGDDYEATISDAGDILTWRLSNGHSVQVTLTDSKVTRVLEHMPWGEDTIVIA